MKKSNFIRLTISVALLSLLPNFSAASAMTGEEVAMEVEKARRGFLDSRSVLLMTLINSSGAESIRKMSSKMFERPD